MKETTIEPYLPMLERFEEFFREELASRLSVESVDSVMEAAVENFIVSPQSFRMSRRHHHG